MNKIDLPADLSGTHCTLCHTEGKKQVAQLLDKDLGPLCHECFTHALRAATALHWITLTTSPSKK